MGHLKKYFDYFGLRLLNLCLVLLQVAKCFVPVPVFCVGPKINLHIVPATNIFCQTKRWFAFSKIGFCADAIFWRGTKCRQIFGLTQKIWTSTKHFVTCKLVQALKYSNFYILANFQKIQKTYISTLSFGKVSDKSYCSTQWWCELFCLLENFVLTICYSVNFSS